MKEGQRLWTRDELMLAVNLYCKLPFGRMHRLASEVIHLANLIDRTPSAVAYKLVNFASLDPSLKARGIKGASNASRLDGEIWADFFNHWHTMAYESEKLLAQFERSSVEQLNHIPDEDLPEEGKVREQVVKARVGQSFFRKSVLAAYNNTCCITGIDQSELLIAGHIRPWILDEKNRLNPRNGIAMNALHDKAFEAGYITITPDYKIKISPLILGKKDQQSIDFFGRFENQPITLPSRFLPDVEFLRYHNEERFKV